MHRTETFAELVRSGAVHSVNISSNSTIAMYQVYADAASAKRLSVETSLEAHIPFHLSNPQPHTPRPPHSETMLHIPLPRVPLRDLSSF